MNTHEIYNRLVELKEQDESSDLEKAELLATVKNGKLYKETHGTFARFADAIGYHRTYCYDLIRVWNCEPVKEAYSEIGAFAATKIAKANLTEGQTRELVDFAKSHKSKEITARIREIKNKGQEPKSKAELVTELLEKKVNLEKQLDEVIAEIERLTGKTSKPKSRKKGKRNANKPVVNTLGNIESILKPFSATRSTLLVLQSAYFSGNRVSTTDLESYATLEVDGLNLSACFDVSEFKTLRKVPLDALFIVNDDRLDITDKGTQSIPLLPDPENEFPQAPQGEIANKTVTLPLNAWELLVATSGASASDKNRPILTAVYLHTVNGQLVAAAADGFVLAVNPLGVKVKEEWASLIPAEQLIKIAKAVKKLKAQTVSITTYRHESVDLEGNKTTTYPHITFEAEGKGARLVVQTQLIDGKFPDYEQFLPRANEKAVKVVVNRQDLIGVSKQAKEAANNTSSGREKAFYTFNGNVKIEAEEDRGTWEISTLRSEGKEITQAFNPKLMAQLLEAMPEVENVVIALQELKIGPAYIMATENGSEAAIMPMHMDR